MAYDLLEGVTVVELAMYAFAPSAAAVLADWGADVVKVVPPEMADPMYGSPVAGLPPRTVEVSFMWEIMNRGKRCAAIDVSNEDGRGVLLELLASADVFLTNMLPGARQRFRLDPEDVFAVNPSIIYARATGHGPKGPEREAGGFDHTDFWARTGMAHAASMAGGEFVPQPGPALGDLTSGGFLAGGVAAALVRRARTGQGAVVDVSLLSSGMWAFGPGVVASRVHDVEAIPRFPHDQLPNALVAAYRTKDDRLVYLAGVQTEAHFDNFCHAVDRADLLADPRFDTAAHRAEHTPELIAVLDEVFAQHDLGEWTVLLQRLSTPWAVIQTAAEALADPQVAANGFAPVVKGEAGDYPLVASPVQFDDELPALGPAPTHGEHTDAVVLGLGKDWDELLRLKASGAVL